MTMIHLKTKCLPSPLRPKKHWRRRRNPNPLQIDSPTIQPYNIISPIRVKSIVDRYFICSEDEIVSIKVTLSHLQPAVCSIGFRAHIGNLMNDRFTLSCLADWFAKRHRECCEISFLRSYSDGLNATSSSSAALAPGSVTWTCAIVTDLEEVL